MAITVWTDGSCWPNPGGPGGWGWVVDDAIYASGGVESSTNQRMEITAVLEALRMFEGDLHVVTDSQYVINCATKKWKAKANRDLWDQMFAAIKGRRVTFEWVKGHNGDPMNEFADALAEMGRVRREPKP